MKPGATFLILAEEPKKHLWVVISDPEIDPEQVLFVHFTTWKPKGDQACVVEGGEHPFIRHRSCVAYRMARCEPVSKLEALLAAGGLQMKEAVSEHLLRRVRDGARDSDFTPMRHRRILDEQGLIDSEDE